MTAVKNFTLCHIVMESLGIHSILLYSTPGPDTGSCYYDFVYIAIG